MSGERLRIVVLGFIVRSPLGGMVWSSLQYLRGLAALGHDVYYFEDSDGYSSCYDPDTGELGRDASYGLRFAAGTLSDIGYGERWAFYDANGARWLGPAADKVRDVCRSADLLLNLAAVNPVRGWLLDVPVRVLIDQDPAFTQVAGLTEPEARSRLGGHNCFLTFGENIPTGRSMVPDDGLPWQATRQPVVMDSVRVTPAPREGKFTTVMQWKSYSGRLYNGVLYGMKSHAFRPFLDLPARTGPVFDLAVAGRTGRKVLAEHGWGVCDPLEPTRTPAAYEEWIRRSKAEFGIAKHGYVVARSGWFSERSVCYLASGRPVAVQDTGFGDWLHADAGVVPFSTPDDAGRAVEDISRRYDVHCRAAREVAAEYFDARKVLPALIETALAGARQGVYA